MFFSFACNDDLNLLKLQIFFSLFNIYSNLTWRPDSLEA